MSNTRAILTIFGFLVALVFWGIINASAWHWLIGPTLWAFAGSLSTSLVVPALGWAVYTDQRAKDRKP